MSRASFVLLATFPLFTACGSEAEQPEPAAVQAGAQAAPPEAPPGTVLLVGAIAISEEEVDRIAGNISLFFPSYTKTHARRLALVEIVLPRAAVAAAYPEQRAAALAACEAARAGASESFSDPDWLAARGAQYFELEGRWPAIGGIEAWALARDLEEGVWSAPYERMGSINLLRRVKWEKPRDSVHYEILGVELLTFPYLPAEDAVVHANRALDEALLVIVDPAWREIVPEAFQYRMRGK